MGEASIQYRRDSMTSFKCFYSVLRYNYYDTCRYLQIVTCRPHFYYVLLQVVIVVGYLWRFGFEIWIPWKRLQERVQCKYTKLLIKASRFNYSVSPPIPWMECLGSRLRPITVGRWTVSRRWLADTSVSQPLRALPLSSCQTQKGESLSHKQTARTRLGQMARQMNLAIFWVTMVL